MVNYQVTHFIRPAVTSALTAEIRWKMSEGEQGVAWSQPQEGKRVVLPVEDLFKAFHGRRGLVGWPGRPK
jgi:hypothetical protein